MPKPPARHRSHHSTLPSVSHKERAAAMLAVAAELDVEKASILKVAVRESHLLEGELEPEFGRMVGTFRMFDECISDGSFFDVANAAPSTTSIGPGHALRAVRVPLGRVLVFGASNFPLAYGVCGGDTASALAAGCPVVVKEHPAHPKTGRLLHKVASSALAANGMRGWLQYVRHTDPADFSVAESLVKDPEVAAIGFTGSVPGGLAIEAMARARHVPIPVFAEMGSLNPVLVSAAAIELRCEAIASALGGSISMRVGQQCTRPGFIFVESGTWTRSFVDLLAGTLAKVEPRQMVAPWIEAAFLKQTAAVARIKGVESLIPAKRGGDSPRLFSTTLPVLRTTERLRAEIFGPAAIVVRMPAGFFASGGERIDAALSVLPGNLTCSIFAEANELSDALVTTASRHAGRIILNGVPTGVRVDRAMVHSGPFPACNRPESTAVGPRAIERWMRAVCIQG